MSMSQDELARKLANSFFSLRRADLHNRNIGGCSRSEIRVLFCIKNGAKSDTPEMKISEISKSLQVTSPTVTQLVKTLEANGLVERKNDESDRRTVSIRLTEKGEQVTQSASKRFYDYWGGLIENLGEEQSYQLMELLQKVNEYKESYEKKTAPWSGDGDSW